MEVQLDHLLWALSKLGMCRDAQLHHMCTEWFVNMIVVYSLVNNSPHQRNQGIPLHCGVDLLHKGMFPVGSGRRCSSFEGPLALHIGFWTCPHCRCNCRILNGLSIMLEKQHVLQRWDVLDIPQPALISCILILWLVKGQQPTTMIYSPQLDLRFLDEFSKFSNYWSETFWKHEVQTWFETAPHSPFLPRLAVVYAMKGKPWNFVAWFGIKCSSWVGVNAGTSWRKACCSIGDFKKLSVRQANQMLERTPGFKKRNKRLFIIFVAMLFESILLPTIYPNAIFTFPLQDDMPAGRGVRLSWGVVCGTTRVQRFRILSYVAPFP